jgi:hypothetical protein
VGGVLLPREEARRGGSVGVDRDEGDVQRRRHPSAPGAAERQGVLVGDHQRRAEFRREGRDRRLRPADAQHPADVAGGERLRQLAQPSAMKV